MAVWPSVGATRLGCRAEIDPKITRTSGSGWWRLKWAILALVSGQVRPRLAAWSRDNIDYGICNPLRGGNAARFGDRNREQRDQTIVGRKSLRATRPILECAPHAQAGQRA